MVRFIKIILPKFRKLVSKAFNEKYLLLTNVVISAGSSGLGDMLEQHYEILTKKLEKLNKTRMTNMTLSGVSVGLVCHYWYLYLDKFLPGYTIRTVLKKIVVDQVIGSPIFISTFFITIGGLEGLTRHEIKQEVQHKAWTLYMAEWAIWPPAQFINFYLLPTKYRVLFDNTISLGYDIFVSYVRHKNPTKEIGNENP